MQALQQLLQTITSTAATAASSAGTSADSASSGRHQGVTRCVALTLLLAYGVCTHSVNAYRKCSCSCGMLMDRLVSVVYWAATASDSIVAVAVVAVGTAVVLKFVVW
jgi:hypothetical protein